VTEIDDENIGILFNGAEHWIFWGSFLEKSGSIGSTVCQCAVDRIVKLFKKY